MSAPTLYVIYDYLAHLIAEREPEKPLLVSQIQSALLYKFPDFDPTTYRLSGLREFVMTGEKAGYFKLVNTGDAKTSYLAPGDPEMRPRPKAQETRSEQLAANDP